MPNCINSMIATLTECHVEEGRNSPTAPRIWPQSSGVRGPGQPLSTSIDHPCVFVSRGDVPFQGTERTIKAGSERDCLVGPWPMRGRLEALSVREALFGAVRPRCVLSPLSFPPPRQSQQPGTMGLAERKAAAQPPLPALRSRRCGVARRQGRGWDVEQQIFVWS